MKRTLELLDGDVSVTFNDDLEPTLRQTRDAVIAALSGGDPLTWPLDTLAATLSTMAALRRKEVTPNIYGAGPRVPLDDAFAEPTP